MVYDGGFMAENEEKTIFSPPQSVVLEQQMARWCLMRHVFLHGKNHLALRHPLLLLDAVAPG